MKKLSWFVILAVIGFGRGQAQEATGATSPPVTVQSLGLSGTNIAALSKLSDQQLSVVINALDATPAVPAVDLPKGGTFWSLQQPNVPPYPTDLIGVGGWELSDGSILLNDVNYDYSAVSDTATARTASTTTMTSESESGPPAPPGSGGGSGTNYFNGGPFGTAPVNTNLLWLRITNVLDGTAYANLYNPTDSYYGIYSTTNLLTPFPLWSIETEVITTQTNRMPFTVAAAARPDLFLRAEDWTGIYSNGLPVWWTWYYYHDLNLSWTNQDAYGGTLGDDYTNGYDPNVIVFDIVVTNTEVNTAYPGLPLSVLGGVPVSVAVLVNQTNLGVASWQPFTNSEVFPTLGADGEYTVLVGLRGFPTNAIETWEAVDLVKNTVFPRLTITNPASGTVSQSVIQLQGFAVEPLNAVTFDVSNASGTVSAQPAFLTGQYYDPNLGAFTTNYFQSDNVYLAGGTNRITVHATDWAGNQTNVSLTVNYLLGAPALSFISPLPGAVLGSRKFTLQAHVINPGMGVSATIGSTTVQGVVERNGTVWVPNLPLNSGTNNVSITVSNANGTMSVTNLTVVENSVGLGVDGFPQFNQTFAGVSGEIGNSNLAVYVNGVHAINLGDGTWYAVAVPVNPAGMAVLNAQVFNGSTLVASQNFYQPQPPMVALMSYSGSQNIIDTTPVPDNSGTYSDAINWYYQTGGSWGGYPAVPLASATNGAGFLLDPPWSAAYNVLPWENAAISVPIPNDSTVFQSQTETRTMIIPSGMQAAGTTNLYLVMARACEFSDTNIQAGFPGYGNNYYGLTSSHNNINPNLPYGGDLGLPPEWLQINGQPLADTGITNIESSSSGGPSISSVWGATVIAAPAGQNWPLTLATTNVYNNRDYTFANQVTNLNVTIFAITNGVAINLSNSVPEFCVGQQVVLSNSFNPPLPAGIPVSYQWVIQGEYVNQITNVDMYGESPLYTNNLALATNNVTSLWWYNGGANLKASCVCTIGGGTATAQGYVNVYRPTLSGFVCKSPRGFIADTALDILSYGDLQTGASNLTWSASINSKYDGYKGVTQIITADWWTEPAPGQTSYHGCADAGEFYEQPTLYYVAVPNSQVAELDDAPNCSIGEYSGEVLFTNTMDYIRFKPGTATNGANIYVTLGIVQWNAHGRYNNLTSTMTVNYTPAATQPDTSEEFPVWDCVKEQ